MNRMGLFFLGAAVLLIAAASDAEAKEGFYIGLGASYNTIGGDFDGSSGLEGGSQVIILPKIDNALGINVRAGYGTSGPWAVEFELMRSVHGGNWDGLEGDVTFTSLSVNGKCSLRPADAVQPYLLLGISHNELLVKKGAADLATGAITDARLSGPGLNLGFGVDKYFDTHVSLGLGFTYRYVDYTEASGAGQKGTIDNGLNGSGFSLGLTAAYHF